jgi:sulfatase modifying factor 1
MRVGGVHKVRDSLLYDSSRKRALDSARPNHNTLEKKMKKIFAVTAVLALLCLGSFAQANITIDTVAIGDAGNAADTLAMNDYYRTTGYGSVDYNYNIGKYEVTAGQYTAFLNAKAATDTYALYNANMWSSSYGCKIQQSGTSGSYTYSVASDYANRPVNYVSYWDGCRFANWLGNGQGTSSTETGAYTLGGYNGSDGRTIRRNAGATWAVTSEDEWYKAAYYKDGVYSLYANGTSTAPVAGTASNWNYAIHHTWDGSTNGALEQNGTKDMMGNVQEWNEGITFDTSNWAPHCPRGGSFYMGSSYLLASWRGDLYSPGVEYYDTGFRVSYVPEPSSLIALLGGLAGLLAMRRRRA